MKRLHIILLSMILVCFSSCRSPAELESSQYNVSSATSINKISTIDFPHENKDVNIWGIAQNNIIYSISNNTFDIEEQKTNYYLYSMETSSTTEIGKIKNAIVSTGNFVTCGDKSYFTMLVERERPQTLLCSVDIKANVLIEEKIIDTKRQLVFLEPLDTESFLMYDCGKEIGNEYHSYVNIYDTKTHDIKTIHEYKIDMATNQGVLLCSVSYDNGYIYCLQQATSDKDSIFAIEKIDLNGTIIDCFELDWISDYFNDSDEEGLYKSILDFVVIGNNILISDYAGSSIIINFNKDILYSGERLSAFALNGQDKYLLSSFINQEKKYLLSVDGLDEQLDDRLSDAAALWSSEEGTIVIAEQEVSDLDEMTISYQQITGGID